MLELGKGYHEIFGRAVDAIPAFRERGLTFMSGKTLMERCLQADGNIGENFRDNHFYIALFNVKDPDDDRVKVVLANEHPELLDRIVPGVELIDEGGLPIEREHGRNFYRDLSGFKIGRNSASELQNDPYALSLLRKGFWEFVAEGDIKLARDFRNRLAQANGLSEDQVMGVCPSVGKGARLYSVYPFNRGFSTYGLTALNYNISHFVGVEN